MPGKAGVQLQALTGDGTFFLGVAHQFAARFAPLVEIPTRDDSCIRPALADQSGEASRQRH